MNMQICDSPVPNRIHWLAIARQALINAQVSPSQADTAIKDLTGDSRDISEPHKQWACDVFDQLMGD